MSTRHLTPIPRPIRTIVPALLVVLALLAFSIDIAVARACHAGHLPKFLLDVLNKVEPFGHGIGVAFVVATIAILDTERRAWAPALCAAGAISGGLTANVIKLLIARTRPRNFSFASADVWQTFESWFPLGAGGSAAQSFPSAHTATAFGFAVALAAIYPRGRWWFFTLATLVGFHRVQSSAHFPSDVFAGAAVGWVMGHLCVLITREIFTGSSETSGQPPQLRIVA